MTWTSSLAGAPKAEVTAPGAGPLAVAHVPYMALTEGEGAFEVPDLVVGRDYWIEYRVAGEWDRYPGIDILLARPTGAPSGKTDGTKVSPYRQFHCMDRLLCQGCGLPAARNPDHPGEVLWVQAQNRRNGEPTASTGPTDMPPSCARCALHWCPVLTRRGRRLVWVREAEVFGVYGDLYPPPRGIIVPEQLVPLDDQQRLSCAVGTRLARDLQRVRLADRAAVEELAARQSTQTRPSCPSRRYSAQGRA